MWQEAAGGGPRLDNRKETCSSQLVLHVPQWGQCWFRCDWSATAKQREKAFGFVVRTERPLLTCVFSRKEKQSNGNLVQPFEMTLTQKNTHTGMSTGITTALTFGRSAPVWLCWLSCACCSFITLVSWRAASQVVFTLDHISPLLLMFLVRMRKLCWSWVRQRWLLSEGLFDCHKDFFYFLLFNKSMTSTVCCCTGAMVAKTLPEVKFSKIRSTKYLHLRLCAVWL